MSTDLIKRLRDALEAEAQWNWDMYRKHTGNLVIIGTQHLEHSQVLSESPLLAEADAALSAVNPEPVPRSEILNKLYEVMCGWDTQDVPLEEYPEKIVKVLGMCGCRIALSAVDQSREEWANQAEELAVDAYGPLAANAHWEDREDHEIKRKRDVFSAYLRTVPDTPGMVLVPVDPVAYCVYLPSMDTQEYFDDLDDLWCVDLLTNNPDAQVTPLYAQPKRTSDASNT